MLGAARRSIPMPSLPHLSPRQSEALHGLLNVRESRLWEYLREVDDSTLEEAAQDCHMSLPVLVDKVYPSLLNKIKGVLEEIPAEEEEEE
jgi:hypothetical protein